MPAESNVPRVLSVHVGLPRDEQWAGRLKRTAIDKHPRTGPVAVRHLGLDGDQVADTVHHGGPDKAVYVFAREDLDWWAGQLGRPVRDGLFGENLTTSGIDVNEALVGERWQIGEVQLELASVRIPCSVFQNWMGENGFDHRHWMRRFFAVGRPGPYLRVLQEGTLRAGDEITVLHRPDHGVSISTMFRALTTEHHLLPELLRIGGLVQEARWKAEEHVAAHGAALEPTSSGSTSPSP